MAAKSYPDATLSPEGSVVSTEGAIPLPNYSGLVLAVLQGHAYILWLTLLEDGSRKWQVVNSGSTIVQSALEQFVRESTVA